MIKIIKLPSGAWGVMDNENQPLGGPYAELEEAQAEAITHEVIHGDGVQIYHKHQCRKCPICNEMNRLKARPDQILNGHLMLGNKKDILGYEYGPFGWLLEVMV